MNIVIKLDRFGRITVPARLQQRIALKPSGEISRPPREGVKHIV